ncbi:MAG: hypothetical protein V7K43_20070 [Nostoc sp.]
MPNYPLGMHPRRSLRDAARHLLPCRRRGDINGEDRIGYECISHYLSQYNLSF